jgi:serine/threonine protein kinase/WD40 repeat protein
MHESDERRQRLEAILAEFLQAADKGQAPDQDEMLARHPDLADELASFFANRAEFAKLAGPAAVSPTEMPTLGADGSATGPIVGDTLRYFGDYEILAEIARGGMGVVFKARQVSLNRVVALKMILTGQLATPLDVQRFKHEAEAAAGLDHLHIVPIHEVGEHGGQHYFSMKLIDGGSLAGCIKALRKDRKKAVQLMTKVARAVHYAHQRGILHRDLKPANILLDKQGEPHVTDFGLAKKVTGDSGMTQSGAIVGTPSYMPPEQAAAKKGLTTAADVYSLGAILYELLTGQPPFQGATPLDTLLQVMEKEPTSPRVIDKTIDCDLETIVLKCLAKQPVQRYASAEALADELDRWQRGESILARRARLPVRLWRWCRRHPWPALTAAAAFLGLLVFVSMLLGIIGIGLVMFQESTIHTIETDRKAGNRSAAMAELRRTSFWQKTLAMRNEAIPSITLPGLDPVSGVSVDGNRGFSMWLGGSPTELDRRLRLSDDGKSVTVFIPQVIQVRAVPTGELISEQPNPSSQVAPQNQFANLPMGMTVLGSSDDARWAVLAAGNPADIKRDLSLWDMTAGKVVHELKGVMLGCPYVRVSADGRRMAYVDGDHASWLNIFDWEQGRYLAYVPAGIWNYAGYLENQAGFSPDGSLFVFYGYHNKTRGLVLYDVEHGEAAGILDDYATVTHSAWSRDGRWLITLNGRSMIVEGMIPLQFSEVIYPTPTYHCGTQGVTQSVFPRFVGDGRLIAGQTLYEVQHGATRTTLKSLLTVPRFESLLLATDVDAWLLDIKPLRDDKSVFTLRRVADGQHAVAFKHPGFADEALRKAGKMPVPKLRHATLSPDGTRLLCLFDLDYADETTSSWSLELWDRERAERIAVWNAGGDDQPFYLLRFAPDGKKVVTLSTQWLMIWNAGTGKAERKMPVKSFSSFDPSRPEPIAFLPDGSQFLWLHDSDKWPEQLTFHETATGKQVRGWAVQNPRPFYTVVAVSRPDGRMVAVTERERGTNATFIKLLDAATGKTLARWDAAHFITGMAFSPDGRTLVCGDDIGIVKVWNLTWIRKELAALGLDW